MANIADPWAFDPIGPTSNSNVAGANVQELCPPSGINNSIRALAGMLAQATSYKSASISASLSTNIAATTTGLFQTVLGTGPINSYGLVAGQQPGAAVVRLLHFASSCSISHGTSIVLLGGASRRTQPGDIQGVIHDHASADVWREWLFSRADGSQVMTSISATTITAGSISASAISTVTLNAGSISATNQVFTTLNAVSASTSAINALTYYRGGVATQSVLQVAMQATKASIADSTHIPFDSTAPLVTEGTQAFSIAFTPRNATSQLIFNVSLQLGGTWSTGEEVIVPLFRDTTCIATGYTEGLATNGGRVSYQYVDSASSTTLRSYSVRFGAGSGDTFLNRGNPETNTLGGTIVSSFQVMEIL